MKKIFTAQHKKAIEKEIKSLQADIAKVQASPHFLAHPPMPGSMYAYKVRLLEALQAALLALQ